MITIALDLLQHQSLILAWVIFPFILGFGTYLFPRGDRPFAILVSIASFTYGLGQIILDSPQTLRLVGEGAVTLTIDSLSGYFILTNALVTGAVILYCWPSDKSAFFYTQLMILHGSLNSIFVSGDFISVYVGLEVISIGSFLLIAYPRNDRSLWVALRYLLVSNTAMLFYLIGAILVYKANQSFAFTGLGNAPREAVALIFLGLLSKGGIFISGLWLPQTHGEAETPISALLSGIVIKAGIFPLVRCALLVPELDPIVRFFGVVTALFGVTYAVLSKDSKRMLAFHTISQLGFILAAPAVGGLYALSHGLVKSCLFFLAGNLPSRDFKVLKKTPLDNQIWGALTLASFSIAGLPPGVGFGAKILTLKYLLPWQEIPLTIAAVGTGISFAKFIFLPHNGPKLSLKPGVWWGILFLLMALVLTSGFYLDAYSFKSLEKAIVTVAIGWLLYGIIIQKLALNPSQLFEKLDHLLGMMSVVLTVLFWMVLP